MRGFVQRSYTTRVTFFGMLRPAGSHVGVRRDWTQGDKYKERPVVWGVAKGVRMRVGASGLARSG